MGKKKKNTKKKEGQKSKISCRQIPEIVGARFAGDTSIEEIQKRIDSLPQSKTKKRILFYTEAI